MTVYVGDGDQVSFAAESVYPHESPPSVSAPEATQPGTRRIPKAARPDQGDAPRRRATVGGPRSSRSPPLDDDGLDLLDIPTVCRRSGLGRSFVYEEIRGGRLPARKYGRLTRILIADYRRWLEAAPAIEPTSAIAHNGGPSLHDAVNRTSNARRHGVGPMIVTEIASPLEQPGDDAGFRRDEQPMAGCDVGSTEVAKTSPAIPIGKTPAAWSSGTDGSVSPRRTKAGRRDMSAAEASRYPTGGRSA